MTIPVQIPTAFKKFTEGVSKLELEPDQAQTVRAMTDELIRRYPGLKDQMFQRENELQRHVNIFVNGTDTRFIDGLDSQLDDGDDVMIVLAIAGG